MFYLLQFYCYLCFFGGGGSLCYNSILELGSVCIADPTQVYLEQYHIIHTT